MLFSKRSLAILFKTPVAPLATAPAAPQAVELSTLVSSRPRASSRAYSSTATATAAAAAAAAAAATAARPRMVSRVSSALRFPGPVGASRGYASDKGKMELYSDEEGSIGAGIDDVAKSDAAYNGETDPHRAAKQVEQDTGKSMQKTPANEDYSKPRNPPADTSKSDAEANGGFERNQ